MNKFFRNFLQVNIFTNNVILINDINKFFSKCKSLGDIPIIKISFISLFLNEDCSEAHLKSE